MNIDNAMVCSAYLYLYCDKDCPHINIHEKNKGCSTDSPPAGIHCRKFFKCISFLEKEKVKTLQCHTCKFVYLRHSVIPCNTCKNNMIVWGGKDNYKKEGD